MTSRARALLDQRVRLKVAVFSATDRMEAGTVARVFAAWTYKNGKQAVSLVTPNPGSIRIDEIAVEKVEAA